MPDPSLDNSFSLTSLRRRWALVAVLGGLFLSAGFVLLGSAWQTTYALRWLTLAALALAYLLHALWRGLESNHRQGEEWLLPGLGAGNGLTILRGFLIAATAGFLLSPWPQGWLSWAPGALYTLAAVVDLFDGYLARRQNHVTALGERLDMSLDGLGVLAATLLVVQYGQAPGWYLLVALARYLFVAGIWLRRCLERPVHDLDQSPVRRPFAGAQMGFVAVALWPLFSPPATHLAATLFALPFLLGFFRDWLAVSGALQPISRDIGVSKAQPGDQAKSRKSVVRRLAFHWLPVLLRIATISLLPGVITSTWQVYVTLLGRLANPAWLPAIWVGGFVLFLGILGIVLLTLGAAGRLAALAVLFAIGLRQHIVSLSPLDIALMILASSLFFLGTGAFSLWKPENRIIFRRLGEPS